MTPQTRTATAPTSGAWPGDVEDRPPIEVKISVSSGPAMQALGVLAAREIEAVEAGVAASAVVVAGQAKMLAPVNNGILKASIVPAAPARAVNAVTVHVGSPLSYAATMEHGRTPGRRLPPLGPLMDWVRKKAGIFADQRIQTKGRNAGHYQLTAAGKRAVRKGEKLFAMEDDLGNLSIAQVAYRLAWSIKKKGIKPRQFMDKGTANAQPMVRTVFERYYRQVMRGLLDEAGMRSRLRPGQ